MLGKNRTVVTATVRVELEIRADSSWGDGCTIEQVKKQAIDSVNGHLRTLVANNERIVNIKKLEHVSIIYKE